MPEAVHRQSITGPHYSRRTARKIERKVQDQLDKGLPYFTMPSGTTLTLPLWAKGARVERVGFFQWQVVITSNRGH